MAVRFGLLVTLQAKEGQEEVLAAFYAYESQVPRIAREKDRGLREMYGADELTTRYFSLHATADIYHSNVWREQLGKRIAANSETADRALASAEAAAKALGALLDNDAGNTANALTVPTINKLCDMLAAKGEIDFRPARGGENEDRWINHLYVDVQLIHVLDADTEIAHLARFSRQILFHVAPRHQSAIDEPIVYRWIAVRRADDSRFKLALGFQHVTPGGFILDHMSVGIDGQH